MLPLYGFQCFSSLCSNSLASGQRCASSAFAHSHKKPCFIRTSNALVATAPTTCLPYRIQKGTRHLLSPYGFQRFTGLCSNSLTTAPTMYLPYRIQKGIKHSLPPYGFQHFTGLWPLQRVCRIEYRREQSTLYPSMGLKSPATFAQIPTWGGL